MSAMREKNAPDMPEVGMAVCSGDGKFLGNVVRRNPENFQIEKCVFFPDEYLAAYDEVERVDFDHKRIYLKKGVEELRPLDPTGPEATGLVKSSSQLEEWKKFRG